MIKTVFFQNNKAFSSVIVKMSKQLNSRCKELVASLVNYFEQGRNNNGPLLPLNAVQEVGNT
jgi:hypothetical protein